MERTINDIEITFQLDLQIKNLMYNLAPKNEYGYGFEALIEYDDKLYQGMKTMKDMLNQMILINNLGEPFNTYLNNIFSHTDNELMFAQGDFNNLSNFYKNKISSMRKDFINSVNENCFGYGGDNMNKVINPLSINELLHLIHTSITRDEKMYQSMPIIEQGKIDEGDIFLYGVDNQMGRDIFNILSNIKIASQIDILSLNNSLFIMARDLGHSLTIEITSEKEVIKISYYIPKICNVEMTNALIGVEKVNEKSEYTRGMIICNKENYLDKLYTLVSKVPTDDDLEILNKYKN